MALPFYLRLIKAYHAQRNHLRPHMAGVGLSPGQPKILNVLIERGSCMQRELAEGCDVQPATVSRILDNMEEEGLVRREEDEGSRRAARVSVTDAGRERYVQWRAVCAEVEREALQGFSEEETVRFSAYLARLYENLTGRKME